MKSLVRKWSVVVGGHKTSVSLEEPFWSALKEISGQRGMTLSEVADEIDTNRQQGNLSSAIRLFVLDHFKSRAAGPTGGSKQPTGHPPAEASLGG
jgi:predicted DNA-binding ribbon-helix-helix protein